MNGKDKKYDIVFWAYIDSVVDRCIPLMVKMNKRGYRTLLFYQNYDMFDNNSVAQEKLISKYGLEVATYSDHLKVNPLVGILTFFIKRIPNRFVRNKLRGIRFRFLDKDVNNEKFISGLIEDLGHKLNVFDILEFGKYTNFPYGSYYVKKLSDKQGIKSISMCHGVAAHYKEHRKADRTIDFKTVIICNEKEKEYIAPKCTESDVDIVPIGDPRFDSSWKPEVRSVFADEARKIVPVDDKINILYISPGLEHFHLTDEKYKALSDMASIAASLGYVRLILKPHPRHRYEDRIIKIMKRNGLKDFIILKNDPMIAYADIVDYVVSPVSSAVFDILPEMPEKAVIYDGFSKKERLLNIFDGHVNFFEEAGALKTFIKNSRALRQTGKDGNTRVCSKDIGDFCNKWVANGEGLDTIIDRYARLIESKIKYEGIENESSIGDL
ncbi:MAG: hypothetical protein ABIG55_03565 [Candidatus Omnitrophota bacterium]